MSDDNHWRARFRAKTVIDEIVVEKTIEEIINRYSGKYPWLGDMVDILRWRLARGNDVENYLRWDQKYNDKDCFLAKIELEIINGHINVLFAEDENEVTLIDIAFIVNDPDDSSITRLLFKNKN